MDTEYTQETPTVVSSAKPKKEPVAEIDEATYHSKRENLILRLRPITRVNVNGREYKKAGLRANFVNGKFVTRDPETIELLDEMLEGPGARKMKLIFYKAPSQRTVKKIMKAQAKADAAYAAEMKKTVDPDEAKAVFEWNNFLETSTKKIKGTKQYKS